MAQCTTVESIENSIVNSESAPDAGSAMSQIGHEPDNPVEIERQLQTARENRSKSMDNIDSAIGSVEGSVSLTKSDTAAVNKVAQQFIKEYDTAEVTRRQEEIDDYTSLAKSQINQANIYLRCATWTAEKLTDKLAPVYSVIASHFATEGRHNINHPIVADMQNGVRSVVGYKNRAADSIDAVRVEAEKLLGNSSMNVEDLLMLAGDALNMEQVPIHNDMLLDNWYKNVEVLKDKIHELQMSDDTDAPSRQARLEKQLAKTQKWIKDLEKSRKGTYTSEHVRSCGMLDGRAEIQLGKIYDAINKLGIDEEGFRQLSHSIAKIQREAEGFLIETGQVTRDQLAQFADYEDFVSFATKDMNRNNGIMDVDSYMPGDFHEIGGTHDVPVSAWFTVQHFANRAAARSGMGDVGRALYLMGMADKVRKRRDKAMWKDKGQNLVDVYDWDKLLAYKYSDDRTLQARYYNIVDTINHGGGIVCVVPERIKAKAGERKYKRVFVQFDPTYNNSELHVTGGDLNKGLTSILHTDNRLNLMGKVTAFMGRTCTSYNIGFSPINSARDVFERMTNLGNRDFVTTDGLNVPGYKLIGAYVAQLPNAFKAMTAQACGKLDPNSELGRYWKDFQAAGLNYTYSKVLGEDRTSIGTNLADLVAAQNRKLGSTPAETIKLIADKFGSKFKTVHNYLMAYNDVFNTAPMFAQYVAMRKYGISERQIRNSVAEILDQSQKGTYTNILRTFFPFVVPTLQGARAMARTCGLAPGADGKFHVSLRGAATVIGLTMGASMLYSFAREALGKDDDTGRYYIDSIPVSQLSRFIPMPDGGEGNYFKVPMAFGVPQLAAELALCLDRVNRGVSDPGSVFPELFASIIRQSAPIDAPSYDFRADPTAWLMQVMSPMTLRPIADVAVNKNYQGRPITYYEPGDDSYKSAADSGWAATAPGYKKLAKLIQTYTRFDFAPEQIRALIKGWSTGALRALPEFAFESDNPARDETGLYAEMGPALMAMGGSMYVGEVGDVARGLFSAEREKLVAEVRRTGVNLVNKELQNKGDEYREWRMEQLRNAGWEEKDLRRFQIMDEANSEIKKSQQGIKKRVAEALQRDNQEAVKQVFREYSETKRGIYTRAINRINDL